MKFFSFILILVALLLVQSSNANEVLDCKCLKEGSSSEYISDCHLTILGNQFNLTLSKLFMDMHSGEVELTFENGGKYYEFFSVSSPRPDNFLGGFTILDDGRAYMHIVTNRHYLMECAERSFTKEESKNYCYSQCDIDWGRNACIDDCMRHIPNH